MNRDLDIAIMASIEAGEKIMEIYSSDFSYELKSDQSPLTIADKSSNDVINEYLLKTDIPILSEENDHIEYDQRKDWSKCWIVDPLDGTKEFIKRNGEFTVNIALVEEGKPVLGVIYVPVVKKLYFADAKKKKAYTMIVDKEEGNSIDNILANATLIQREDKGNNEIKVVGSRSHMNRKTEDYIDLLKKEGKEIEVISKGSSLKFCLVAEGIADVYPRFAPTMEWDTAAAHAICNSCGISVTSNETDTELIYNKENLLNPEFICK